MKFHRISDSCVVVVFNGRQQYFPGKCFFIPLNEMRNTPTVEAFWKSLGTFPRVAYRHTDNEPHLVRLPCCCSQDDRHPGGEEMLGTVPSFGLVVGLLYLRASSVLNRMSILVSRTGCCPVKGRGRTVRNHVRSGPTPCLSSRSGWRNLETSRSGLRVSEG